MRFRLRTLRPRRFSLRAMFVVVTLVCLYLAAREGTRTFGVKAVVERERIQYGVKGDWAISRFPLIVETTDSNIKEARTTGVYVITCRRYLWLGKIFLLKEWKYVHKAHGV